MKTSTVCLLTMIGTSLSYGAAETPAALPVSSTVSVANPNAKYALSIGRPNAAQAEAGPEGLFTASDAVAKARSQVERELALLGTASSSSATSSSLIVPRKESDPKALADTEEDMTVMSHLLDKAVSSKDDKSAHAMGITVHSAYRSGAIPRSLYLEGYGALFFLNVNCPLVPPAKKDDSQTKEESNTEWENARRELFQPSSYSSDFPKFYAFDTDGAFFSSSGQVEEYDADKVNDLKNNLIGALKNAANIRKLSSDETVTIIVTGRSNETKPAVRKTTSGTRSANVWTTTRMGATDSKGTRLILRAKKSDIEAFQKQKTTADDFRKQVTIMTY